MHLDLKTTKPLFLKVLSDFKKQDTKSPAGIALVMILEDAIASQDQSNVEVKQQVVLKQPKTDRKTQSVIIPANIPVTLIKVNENMILVEYHGKTHYINRSNANFLMKEL